MTDKKQSELMQTTEGDDMASGLFDTIGRLESDMWALLHKLTTTGYKHRGRQYDDVLRAAKLAQAIKSIEEARGLIREHSRDTISLDDSSDN